MFERLKLLYSQNKLGNEEVENAVRKGWITGEEFKEITGEKYESEG